MVLSDEDARILSHPIFHEHVRISGLVKQTHLNGVCGKIVGEITHDGRYPLQIDGVSTKILVKRENIERDHLRRVLDLISHHDDDWGDTDVGSHMEQVNRLTPAQTQKWQTLIGQRKWLQMLADFKFGTTATIDGKSWTVAFLLEQTRRVTTDDKDCYSFKFGSSTTEGDDVRRTVIICLP